MAFIFEQVSSLQSARPLEAHQTLANRHTLYKRSHRNAVRVSFDAVLMQIYCFFTTVYDVYEFC